MLARVAETLYWMARYIERSENLARIIKVNSNLLLDIPKGVSTGWRPLLDITSTEENYLRHHDDYEEKNVLKFLINDTENTSSIVYSLWSARENARTVRDVIPREAWEHINMWYHYSKENARQGLSKRNRFQYLNEVILRSQTLCGMLAGTMNHNTGYVFVKLGRNLERADMTSRLVDVRTASLLEDEQLQQLRPFENIQWMSVLKSLTAYQMYRQEMQMQVRRQEVVKFLFQSTSFPRAVMHCLLEVERAISQLPNPEDMLRIIGRAKRLVDREDLVDLKRASLHQFIDEIQIEIGEVSSALSSHYFLSGLNAPAVAEAS